MKMKKKKKEAMEKFKCFSGLNGKLDILLRRAEPAFYTSGVYGHNADIFVFGRYAIVTGPRPFGEEVPSRITEHLENTAAVLYHIDRKDEIKFFKEFSDYVESGRFEKMIKG